MHTEFPTEVYARGGEGKNARWEWVVYDLDGITPLDRGETIGALKIANAAARSAAFQLYLNKKRNKE